MADAAGHKFGQVLGNFLESAVLSEILKPSLAAFSRDFGYYLDSQGSRKARSGKRVVWKDIYDNEHSLDFVIEAGGSAEKLGRPIAFIESAWRRYTKHSKNKAQEIQGAVLPILEKYKFDAPFAGVVLAGEFTEPSIQQLKSNGFSVIHIPYAVIVEAFSAAGLEIAFDESSKDREYLSATRGIERLSPKKIDTIKQRVSAASQAQISQFLARLEAVLRRHIVRILIQPAWGEQQMASTALSAKSILQGLDVSKARGSFLRFELTVQYSNGDSIRADFSAKADAVEFIDRLAGN